MTHSGRAASPSFRLRGDPGRTSARARPAPFLLGALILLGSAEQLFAQTREELRAAMRRLRQVEASLQPLPNTGITRDAGQIAIVEHDESNYNARLDDGTLNYEARTRVGLRFYETHADAYDFLVVFTNFAFQTSDATAFHLFGRNDVEGIGKPVGSLRAGMTLEKASQSRRSAASHASACAVPWLLDSPSTSQPSRCLQPCRGARGDFEGDSRRRLRQSR